MQCTDYTRGERSGDILPNSTYENPRRSLILYFTMARTKEQEAVKLAKVAHCMDNYLRQEYDKLITTYIDEQQFWKFQLDEATTQIKDLRTRLNLNYETYVQMLRRREARIRELEASWEDLANSLTDAIEENRGLANRVENLERQVLDCECNEE